MNGDGSLEFDEEEIDEMIAQADTDGDGVVSPSLDPLLTTCLDWL